jgi:plasmid stabilization system protein ParE
MAPRRRRIVWTFRARQALDDAIGFVAAEAPQAAERLLIRVLDAADTLSQMAERGRIVPEIGETQIRELITSPYRLMYRVSDNDIHILSLVHERQQFAFRSADFFKE